MSAANLTYLTGKWLDSTGASKALRSIPRLSEKKKRSLFRHHDETDDGISDAETYPRDDLDYLLGFYGIIEIGLMTGFLDGLPAKFADTHLPILSDPAIRRYYEYNYPLELPRRLRDRMQLGIRYRGTGDGTSLEAFFRFLELTETLERDEEMESFLWCLDGGDRSDAGGRSNISRLQSLLAKPDGVAKAWAFHKKAAEYEISFAVRGFWKFVQFCQALARLLDTLKSDPQVAEAMWLYHAYWFHQLNIEIGDKLHAISRAISRWQVGPDEQASVKARAAEIEGVFKQLAVPPLTYLQIARIKPQTSFVLSSEEIKRLVTNTVESLPITFVEPATTIKPIHPELTMVIGSEELAAKSPTFYTKKLLFKSTPATLITNQVLKNLPFYVGQLDFPAKALPSTKLDK